MNRDSLLAKGRVATSIGTLYVGRASGVLVALLFLPYYSRALGPPLFGVVVVILSMQALLVSTDFGISAFVGRRIAATGPTADHAGLLRVAELALVCVYTIALLLAPVLIVAAGWTTPNALEASICVVMFLAIVLQNLYFAAMTASRAFLQAGVSQFIGVLSRAVATVVAFELLEPSVTLFISVQCAVSVLHGLFMRWCLWRSAGLDGSRVKAPTLAEAGLLIGSSRSLAVTSLAGAAVMQLDKPIITALVSAAAVAPYYLAATLSLLPIGILAGPISQYHQPFLTRLIASSETAPARRTVARFVTHIAVFALLPCAVLWLMKAHAVSFWLGEDPIAPTVASYVGILLPGCAVGALGYVPSTLLLAAGDFRFQATLSLFLTVVTLSCAAVAAAVSGAEAVCYVYSLYHVASTTFSWVRASRLPGLRGIAAMSAVRALASSAAVLVPTLALWAWLV